MKIDARIFHLKLFGRGKNRKGSKVPGFAGFKVPRPAGSSTGSEVQERSQS